ncbi:MAG: hypothetical protein AB7O45_04805 [Alphaproteobacteria bacterium]
MATFGSNGVDVFGGTDADDGLRGEDGDDTLYAGDGFFGGLIGGAGDDLLHADDQSNFLYGMEGSDTILAGPRDDMLIVWSGHGIDHVHGFDVEDHLIILDVPINGLTIDSFAALQERLFDFATRTGSGAGIDLGQGNELLLYGIGSSQLTASNFQFDPLQGAS